MHDITLPSEVVFEISSPNVDAEAVQKARKQHVSPSYFLLYRMPQRFVAYTA